MSELVMAPPNLRIWAERKSTIDQGPTQGESRIGFEGAGLADDTNINIYTEWYGENGRPLPEALGDYGYTARLAKVVDENYNLEAVTGSGANQLSQFAIKPGRQLQVIRLPEENIGNQHLYLQVSGEPKDRNPDFGSTGVNEGILTYRPDQFVPFKVPVYDEEASGLKLQAYRQTNEADPNLDLEQPEPAYQWAYRPEFQFSIYDLEVQAIRRENALNESEDILELDAPFIASDDALLEFHYDLYAPGNGDERLDALQAYAYDNDQELIFTLGEQELRASYGPDGKLRFDNLEHLSQLAEGDALTLRLYANNDTANTLWEYAFLSLAVSVDLNRDGKLTFDVEQEGPEDIAGGAPPTDRTTPSQPYRFWVNNDLDVVSYKGEIQWDLTHCTSQQNPLPAAGEEFEQECEQWDENPGAAGQTNTQGDYGRRLKHIESYRDLEDFLPMAVRLGSRKVEDVRLVLTANNINVNLFPGTWNKQKKAHAYIFDAQETIRQVRAANQPGAHVVTLRSGDEARLYPEQLNELLDTDGDIRLILEAIAPNEAICAEESQSCYLSIALVKIGEDESLAERKVYFDFRNIEDFYETWTAGTAEPAGFTHNADNCFEYSVPGFPEPPNHLPAPHDIEREDDGKPPLWVYDGVRDATPKRDKAILVHGWRMRDIEKQNFAETAFKRLYWLGYQGRFAAVTWPTGWFYKPAHCYGIGPAQLAAQHAQNYDQSEVVARLTGAKLKTWLKGQRSDAERLHLIAHSMGNVVVSEALRHAEELLVDSYAASQAAEVGGSYDSALVDMAHLIPGSDIIPGADAEPLSPEEAWRKYNNEVGLNYDMPPDVYRFNNIITDDNGTAVMRHGETTTAQLTADFGTGNNNYYREIGTKSGRIVNFFNTGDAALTAWEFNQLTKPDYSKGPEWEYSNEQICAASSYDEITGEPTGWSYPDGAPCAGPSVETVSSRFYRDVEQLDWDPQRPVDGSEAQTHYVRILGHIIPARTNALGQVDTNLQNRENGVPFSDISGGSASNRSFTTSNQGHSAQFHGYLSEPGRGRGNYWLQVMEESFRLNPQAKGVYSGLYTDKLKVAQ
ncbi:hypothetical protein [Thiohalomonas denitrificans]|uniref:hypothetical protein n=1 Tax=Thiohalomonas denitrificans TaxID=415747 RepID=UPI0026EAEB6A|nr:hypothetical protein [Thiohalomonas denitrificans]